MALAADSTKQQPLEISRALDFQHSETLQTLRSYFAEAARRLRNPRPDCYVTLLGLPLSFGNFAWPFHQSTSGADTSIVHGEVWLQDGTAPVLHSKVSASMTVTFQDVVGVPEQPFAEGYIYNAVRKIFDQGQLELVKSGNRQPVPVTMRYYSMRQKKFIFNDTTPEQRKQFLAAKAYWLSGVLGEGPASLDAGPARCPVSERHRRRAARRSRVPPRPKDPSSPPSPSTPPPPTP